MQSHPSHHFDCSVCNRSVASVFQRIQQHRGAHVNRRLVLENVLPVQLNQFTASSTFVVGGETLQQPVGRDRTMREPLDAGSDEFENALVKVRRNGWQRDAARVGY